MNNFKVNIIDVNGKKTSTTINESIVSYYRYIFITDEQKASYAADTVENQYKHIRLISQTLLNNLVADVIEKYEYASKEIIEFEMINKIHLGK